MNNTIFSFANIATFLLVMLAFFVSIFSNSMKKEIGDFATEYRSETRQIDSLYNILLSNEKVYKKNTIHHKDLLSSSDLKPDSVEDVIKNNEQIAKIIDDFQAAIISKEKDAVNNIEQKTKLLTVLLTHKDYIQSKEFALMASNLILKDK